jgi:hypothetical protein
VPFLSPEGSFVAQVVQTRDATKAGWKLPLPKLRINARKAGITLMLGAWLAQAYAESIVSARTELARSLQMSGMQREVWLIEYNASLIRYPRNERVTARAAFQVVKNTHELLALADIAAGGIFANRSEILRVAEEHTAQARELFEARNYGSLVGELDEISQTFETRLKEGTLDTQSARIGVRWWQHVFPALFLLGVFLCWKGARREVEYD